MGWAALRHAATGVLKYNARSPGKNLVNKDHLSIQFERPPAEKLRRRHSNSHFKLYRMRILPWRLIWPA
jgi:hypothetical protein